MSPLLVYTLRPAKLIFPSAKLRMYNMGRGTDAEAN